MNVLLFILSCFGLTNILVYGSIFNKIRPKHYFFNCPMCMGFWVGFLVYILFDLSNVTLFNNFIIGLFLFSSISSGTSYVMSILFDDYGFKINNGGNR